MHNDEVLGHLLEIESEAAALVDNAQAEADRRVLEAEKQNRIAYEEHYHRKIRELESDLRQSKDHARQQYQKELDAYKEKINSVAVNMDQFSALMNRLVEEEE
ncbi:MAG: hypothetical protein FWD36_00060 [Treponema sp.]|nr:hypothetical protein [Treponema sp.]